MHSIDQFGSLVVAVIVFQLIPGPGTLTILRATSRHGLKAGFAAIAGTLLGGLVCMLAAASGLDAVFRGQPQAIHLLQTLGSMYLAWMGWRILRQRRREQNPETELASGLVQHLREGLVVSLTNPKVILFYFALLPLFFRPPVTPISLGAVICCVSGISFVYQSGLVLAGNAAARRLSARPMAGVVARRLAGLVLIGFAIKLFLV